MPAYAMPAESIYIRDSRAGDIPEIAVIYAEAVRHGTGTFEIEPPGIPEMTQRREALIGGGYPYLVAELGGNVAGYCYAGVYRTRPAYRFSVEDSVYVAPRFQKQGIGRKLLDALIARCEEKDFRLMIAIIGDSANTSSIRLHAAAGFTHAGVLPNVGWKLNRWLDTVLMTRALGAAASEGPRTD